MYMYVCDWVHDKLSDLGLVHSWVCLLIKLDEIYKMSAPPLRSVAPSWQTKSSKFDLGRAQTWKKKIIKKKKKKQKKQEWVRSESGWGLFSDVFINTYIRSTSILRGAPSVARYGRAVPENWLFFFFFFFFFFFAKCGPLPNKPPS